MLQESLSQFIQFVLWFPLIETLISCYWLSKAPYSAEGGWSLLSPLLTLKWSKELHGEREVRGRMMSETHLNAAWDVRREWKEPEWKRKFLIEAKLEKESDKKRETERWQVGFFHFVRWGWCSARLDIVYTIMVTPKAIMMRFYDLCWFLLFISIMEKEKRKNRKQNL